MVKLERELYLSTNNEKGCLAKWCGTLAEAGVNIWGVAGWTEENESKACFAFVCDNPEKAKSTLSGAGYKTEENTVVSVEVDDKPGSLCQVTQKLAAAGLDGKYLYVSTCGTCPKCRLFIGTGNNNKAVEVLS